MGKNSGSTSSPLPLTPNTYALLIKGFPLNLLLNLWQFRSGGWIITPPPQNCPSGPTKNYSNFIFTHKCISWIAQPTPHHAHTHYSPTHSTPLHTSSTHHQIYSRSVLAQTKLDRSYLCHKNTLQVVWKKSNQLLYFYESFYFDQSCLLENDDKI